MIAVGGGGGGGSGDVFVVDLLPFLFAEIRFGSIALIFSLSKFFHACACFMCCARRVCIRIAPQRESSRSIRRAPIQILIRMMMMMMMYSF